MRDFSKVDRKAPRYQRTRPYPIGTNTVRFERFLKVNKIPLTIPQVKKLMTKFHEYVIDYILTNRDGIELPSHTGRIFMGSWPSDNKIDVKTSLELGKEVHYKNINTGGYRGWSYYLPTLTPHVFPECNLWGFYPSRYFKKMIAHIYRDTDEWKRFIILKDKTISKMVDRVNFKNYIQRKEAHKLEYYNEFNFR